MTITYQLGTVRLNVTELWNELHSFIMATDYIRLSYIHYLYELTRFLDDWQYRATKWIFVFEGQ